MRQYVRVYQAAESARSDDQVPHGPMADLYFEMQDDVHLQELRETVRQLRRRRKPKREIDKAIARVEKFEAAMAAKRAKARKST